MLSAGLPTVRSVLGDKPWLWPTVIVVVLLIIWLLRKLEPIKTYNGLVLLRNKTQNAWSQIDVQLKRRHDLILNFVEVVKGYAKHERGTLDEVTQARSMAVNAKTVSERAQAENALSATMRTLYAVVEAYPDLKANSNFLSLQQNLTSTEDALADSRQRYNNTVLEYNTNVQTFPTNLLARLFRFRVRDFFELKSETEREAPVAAF